MRVDDDPERALGTAMAHGRSTGSSYGPGRLPGTSEGLRSGRRRFRTAGTRDRRWDGSARRGTNRESIYGDRRLRQQADDAGEGDESGIRPIAGVAHFACAFAFTLVMHRAHLAGQESGTAGFVVVDLDGAAAECQRRGDNAGQLAREPDANHPRDATTDERHGTESA